MYDKIKMYNRVIICMKERYSMNKKGFTLIELLAVIVILAIIALIATPIVLNIINDVKEQAGLRSADFYLDALELSIAQATLEEKNIIDGVYNIKEGNLCLNNICTDKLDVEINGEVPKSGTISIKKGQIEDISLNIDNKIILKKDGELVYLNTIEDICELKKYSDETKISAGDKYECKVKAGTKYTFYVLAEPNANAPHVSLIMDRNMCSDGTPTDNNKQDKCLVEYNSSGDAKDEGPVTAIEYLNQATSYWSNIPNLNITYDDEGSNFINFKITGKARLPYYREVNVYGNNYDFLYIYLNEEISCYWTFSTCGESLSDGARNVVASGTGTNEVRATYIGVRPVITLKL